MLRTMSTLALVLSLGGALDGQSRSASPHTVRVIAHRGASAYAPEHTAAAYRLALDHGADYVEQDLAVTKDGVLVCLHDDTLERTTNVAAVFPDRAVLDPVTGERHWWVVDFTLAELKQLDAGSWFSPAFASERILTWEEAVSLVGTRAGLYPELKSPPLYRSRGIDMVSLFAASLRKLGLEGAAPSRLIVQSFDADTLAELARTLPGLAQTFLVDPRAAAQWFTPEGLAKVRTFATDIGPGKQALTGRPGLVSLAHQAGLTVTPYTFSSRAPGAFPDVTAEMRHFIRDLGVDAVFTDNPDLAPR